MNKLYLFLLVIPLFLISCSKRDLSESIPVDAMFVMKVDAKSIVDKSEYDVFENATVLSYIDLAKMALDEDQKNAVNDFLKDSNSLGLDIKGDYFIFVNENYVGLLMHVNNAQKIYDLTSPLTQDNEIVVDGDFYQVIEDKNVVVWNSSTLAFISKIKSYDEDLDLIQYAKSLLIQEKKSGINSLTAYKEFASNTKDISFFYSINNIVNVLEEKEKESLEGLELIKTFEGVSYGGYVNFEKGSIVSEGVLLYDSNESRKRVEDYYKQFVGKISGNHLKFIPENPLFFASANLKTDNIVKYILDAIKEDNKDISADEMEIINTVSKNIYGDITFAINKLSVKKVTVLEEETKLELETDSLEYEEEDYFESSVMTETTKDEVDIDFVLLADLVDPTVISDLLTSKLDSIDNLTIIGKDTYSSKIDDKNTLYFGVANKMLYLTTNIDLSQKIVNDTKLDKSHKIDYKNKSLFVDADISKLVSIALNYEEEQSIFVENMVKSMLTFDKAELYLDCSKVESRGELELTNKTDNSLKTIAGRLETLINILSIFAKQF